MALVVLASSRVGLRHCAQCFSELHGGCLSSSSPARKSKAEGPKEGNGAEAYISFGIGETGIVLIIVTQFSRESVSHEVAWKLKRVGHSDVLG